MPSSRAAPAWWEKTVEYAFIQQAMQKWGMSFLASPGSVGMPGQSTGSSAGASAAAPDGNATGHALLSPDCKWMLIEFRKNKAAIAAEKGRFYDFDVSRSVIEALERSGEIHSRLHRIVYGKPNAQGGLCLGSAPYWPTPAACPCPTCPPGCKPPRPNGATPTRKPRSPGTRRNPA